MALRLAAGAAHLVYGRCTIEEGAGAMGCSGLRYATDRGGAFGMQPVSLEASLGASLWVDRAGTLLHAAATGPSVVTRAVRSRLQEPATGAGWVSDEVGALPRSDAVEARSWLWSDGEGATRIAWVDDRRRVHEVRQLVHDLRSESGWREEPIPVAGGPEGMGGGDFVAAYGGAGGLHFVYSSGDQTTPYAKEPPRARLNYVDPAGTVTEVLSGIDQWFESQALAIDDAGRAHLLFARQHDYAQASSLAYATNESGSWVVEEIPMVTTSAGESVVSGAAALAVDEAGAPQLAFIGMTRPGGRRVLVVGHRAPTSWQLAVLDEAAIGEPAIAAAGGEVRAAYFTEDALKVARICPR